MNRRTILGGLSAAVLTAIGGGVFARFSPTDDTGPFIALFKDSPMLRALGRVARERTFAALDRTALVALATGGSDATSSTTALRASIAAARTNDIAAARMVTVDGWVLPAAEAAVLALAADDRLRARV